MQAERECGLRARGETQGKETKGFSVHSTKISDTPICGKLGGRRMRAGSTVD